MIRRDLVRRVAALALIGGGIASGCGPKDDMGGHTNWLRCDDLGDCASHPDAVACSRDGFCVDAEGNRVTVAGGSGSGGGPARDASADGRGVSGNAGAGGNGATTDAEVGRGGGTSGSAGTSAGGSSGDTGGTSGSGGAGENLDSGLPPDGSVGEDGGTAGSGDARDCGLGAPGCGEEGSPCCDPFPCGDGVNFCHGTLQCCGNGICRATCTRSDEIRIPECPGDMTEGCASETCLQLGGTCVECAAGQVCLELRLSCGPAGGRSAQCVDDPCAGETLDCSCGQSLCQGLEPAPNGWSCGLWSQELVGPGHDPFLVCSGGGICASPETRIATPSGEVAIAALAVGDLVYSKHAGAIEAVPLIAVARTPVSGHHVLRVGLDDGIVLEVSGPHPVADGRRLDALSIGDALDGRSVLSLESIAYEHRYTYDILPQSDSGAYVANGVWLGSTLRPAHARP